MSISAAALVILFGDELDEVGTARLGTTTMPGREEKVSTKDLAAATIALTVWAESRSGALDLSIDRKKRLGLVPTTSVVLCATGQAPTGRLAQALAAGAERPAKLEVTLRQALGGDSLDPSGAVLSLARGELNEAGILVAKEMSRSAAIGRALTGKDSAEAVPGAVDHLRPEWDVLQQSWSAWRTAQPDDAAALFKQAKNALTATTIAAS